MKPHTRLSGFTAFGVLPFQWIGRKCFDWGAVRCALRFAFKHMLFGCDCAPRSTSGESTR